MGEAAIAQPGEKLQCIGLGSCLALVAFDATTGWAGMAHTMLPRPVGADPNPPPAKYVSNSVVHLIKLLSEAGANVRELRFAIIGGAHLLMSPPEVGKPLPQLGTRNVEEARLAICSCGHVVVAEDIGGTVGRTVTFDPASGELHLRTTSSGTRVLANLRKDPTP